MNFIVASFCSWNSDIPMLQPSTESMLYCSSFFAISSPIGHAASGFSSVEWPVLFLHPSLGNDFPLQKFFSVLQSGNFFIVRDFHNFWIEVN